MKNWSRVLSLVGVAALSFGFAAANANERVTLHFGLFTLRSVSLPLVVFAAVLVGMIAVFAVGLRADLRTRRMLRSFRNVLEDEE